MPKGRIKDGRTEQVARHPSETVSVLGNANRSPLYHQIYLILRSRILDGEYGPGDYLPGQLDLGALFRVSRITAERALNELASEGLVVRERGRGTRVQFVSRGIVARGPVETEPELSVASSRAIMESLAKEGWASVKVYEFSYVKSTLPVAEALRLQEGDLVQFASRVWRAENKPFSYLMTYVPEDIGRQWGDKDLEKLPLSTLLEKYGVHVALVQEQVTATLADMHLSQRLEVSAGSPILKIRRVAFDSGNRPVEFVTGFYPPDRYQYEVTLK